MGIYRVRTFLPPYTFWWYSKVVSVCTDLVMHICVQTGTLKKAFSLLAFLNKYCEDRPSVARNLKDE